MSHTASVKSIQIVSIDALREAVTELVGKGIRISLKEKATPRAYFTNQAGMGQADYVIELADSKYDVGLYKTESGGYEARTDFYMGSVEGVLGCPASSQDTVDQAKMGKLFSAYATHAAIEQARKKGHMVMRRTDETTGITTLEITGPGL